MNQQKITQIESKIKEIQNLLTNWTKNIETYHSQLAEIINQLNFNQKSIAPEALNKNKK